MTDFMTAKNFLGAFAIATGLSACTPPEPKPGRSILASAELFAQKAPQQSTVTTKDQSRVASIGDNWRRTTVDTTDVNYFAVRQKAKWMNCPMVPADNYADTGNWKIDCTPGLNFSEVGVLLIKQVLDGEARVKYGVQEKATPVIDNNAYRFTG
jgi:hypothetical protein